MKRVSLILGVVAISFVASSQTEASYQIIRWPSGFCQIWNNSIPGRPLPNDYKTGRKTFKTFEAATAVRAQLAARRQCW